jgi:hypothetical protein
MMNYLNTITFKQAAQSGNFSGWDRNLFSSSDWLTVLEKTYHLQLFVKYIQRDNGVTSYVLYSVVKNFLEWKICILSYCDYCDCQVSSFEDWQMIFQSLRAEYPRFRIAIRNLRDENVRRIPELKELSREKFHILDVRDDLDTIWRRAHDSFKAAVNQAKRNGVVVKRCGKEDLLKFYDLHLKIRKYKYRIFPQPYKFFDIIWEQYMDRDRGVLLGAFDSQGKFIGGNVYLICGNTLYYKFNTSSQAALGLRPNNLVFWEGIRLAKERNLQFLDLGSSGLHQKGLILFKDHTGASSQEIIHLGFEPRGYRYSQKRILKVMTSFFTQSWMPNAMVRWGSHVIYPFLA